MQRATLPSPSLPSPSPPLFLSLLILLLSYPLASCQFWDTAEPAFTWASGGAILTVRGFFPTLNYTCSLLPSAAQQTPVACPPIAHQQMQTELRFSLPVWQLAAQDATVQITDATTRKVLKGPGGASEKITIVRLSVMYCCNLSLTPLGSDAGLD